MNLRVTSLVLTMRDRLVACCPCFETLASLAPPAITAKPLRGHEVVVFQQARPHPEEAAKWPSRRMGCNTDLSFQVLDYSRNRLCFKVSGAPRPIKMGTIASPWRYRAQVVRISTLGRRGRWWGLLSRPLQMR